MNNIRHIITYLIYIWYLYVSTSIFQRLSGSPRSPRIRLPDSLSWISNSELNWETPPTSPTKKGVERSRCGTFYHHIHMTLFFWHLIWSMPEKTLSHHPPPSFLGEMGLMCLFPMKLKVSNVWEPFFGLNHPGHQLFWVVAQSVSSIQVVQLE